MKTCWFGTSPRHDVIAFVTAYSALALNWDSSQEEAASSTTSSLLSRYSWQLSDGDILYYRDKNVCNHTAELSSMN